MSPGDAPIEWTEDGRPRSSLYGDAYFGADDGLAESRAVFLEGCGLPAAWRGRRNFTVAELGFGTGLNILALLDLWRRERPSGGRLHLFSVEAHLMPREDAARALAAWPELAPLAQILLARWPQARKGFHRIDLPEFGASLDIALMEAGEALRVPVTTSSDSSSRATTIPPPMSGSRRAAQVPSARPPPRGTSAGMK